MAVRLDHTILDVKNLAESVAFFRDVVGLRHRGRSGSFEVMLITHDLALDLDAHVRPAPRHLAFGSDRATFEPAFERRSTGIHGATDSVYFHEPGGHLLEILTYDD